MSTRQSKVDGTLASGSLAIMLSLHAPRRQTSGVRSVHKPSPAGPLPDTDEPIGKDRTGPDLDDRPLYSVCHRIGRSFRKIKLSWVLASSCAGRVAGGHFRRAQPSQFAHGCAPTGERLGGDFMVERNSFRSPLSSHPPSFSVALVPFEQANRSAGKKRNEFRSTAPGHGSWGREPDWLMVAHPTTQPWGGRATRFPAPRKRGGSDPKKKLACSPFLGPVIMGVTCSLIQ